jgi:hypothetical protein
MPFSSDSHRIFASFVCLAALILVLGTGRALAADSFSGNYGGVCFGITDSTGSDQHYSYWANYTVGVWGGLSGNGQLSKQDGAAPPVTFPITDTYQLFRREGVLMGLNKLPENRSHGRLSDDLEYGLFVPLHETDDWYLAMIGPTYSGVPLDNSALNNDWWFVRYELRDVSGSETHICEHGSETYDGLGNVSYNFVKNIQDVGAGLTGTATQTYTVASDGDLARYAVQEIGFVLDNGLLLASSRVAHDDSWGITLSALKPPPGVSSVASLQGPYWLARFQYNNQSSADLHAVSLGEAYFDGTGGVDIWMTLNIKGYGLTSGYTAQTYTVASDGAFSLGGFRGGVGMYNRVVLAAEAETANKWGIMVMIKRSGIEDLSPMCHLLGLTP